MFRKNKLDQVHSSHWADPSIFDPLAATTHLTPALSYIFNSLRLFLFSLLTEGVRHPRSIHLFLKKANISKIVCLGKLFLDQLEAFLIGVHDNASIVRELSLCLIQQSQFVHGLDTASCFPDLFRDKNKPKKKPKGNVETDRTWKRECVCVCVCERERVELVSICVAHSKSLEQEILISSS